MKIIELHEAIAQIEPHIFRIFTQDGSGTGFLVSKSSTTNMCAIATAGHVVSQAHHWEQPIRIRHFFSGKTVLFRPGDRAINLNPELDTASIVFSNSEFDLPEDDLPLIKEGFYIKAGVEIGWLGFPAIPSAELCFFSGRISTFEANGLTYLVDGVAINGVSGGPVFRPVVDSAEVVGLVSAYIPNRATGDILPGLSVVLSVNEYHDLANRFRSADEAKEQETPVDEADPPRSPEAPEGTPIE